MPTFDVDDESFKADVDGEAPHSPEDVGDAKGEAESPVADNGDAKGQIEAAMPDGQAEVSAQALAEVAAPDGLVSPEEEGREDAPQKAGRWWQCFSSKASEPIPAEPPVEALADAAAEAPDSKDITQAPRAQTMPPNMKPLGSPVPPAGAEDQKANDEDLPAGVVEDAPVAAAKEDAPPAEVVEKVTAAEKPPEQVAESKRGSAQELQVKLAKQLQKEEEGISAVDHVGPKEGAVTKVHSELRHKLEKQAKKAETGEVEPGVAGVEEGLDENAAGDDVLAVEGVGVEGVRAPTGQA